MPFAPTYDWQNVPVWQAVPVGLEVSMKLGEKNGNMARIPPTWQARVWSLAEGLELRVNVTRFMPVRALVDLLVQERYRRLPQDDAQAQARSFKLEGNGTGEIDLDGTVESSGLFEQNGQLTLSVIHHDEAAPHHEAAATLRGASVGGASSCIPSVVPTPIASREPLVLDLDLRLGDERLLASPPQLPKEMTPSQQAALGSQTAACAVVCRSVDGGLISDSGLKEATFDASGQETNCSEFAESVAQRDLHVPSLPKGCTITFTSSSDPWDVIYFENLRPLALELQTKDPTARLIIVSPKASDPPRVTANAQQKAFDGLSNVTVFRVKGDGEAVCHVHGGEYYGLGLYKAENSEHFGNCDPAHFDRYASQYSNLTKNDIANLHHRVVVQGVHSSLQSETSDVVLGMLNCVLKKFPTLQHVLNGDPTPEHVEAFKKAMTPATEASVEKDESVNYVLVFGGEDVTMAQAQAAINTWLEDPLNEVPLGLTAIRDYAQKYVDLGLGDYKLTLFNSGESCYLSRALKHVPGQGNPLPRVLAKIFNSIKEGTVTNEKCAFVAFVHSNGPGSTDDRKVAEAILGAVLGSQPQYSSNLTDFDIVKEMASGMGISGLQWLSAGWQRNRLLFQIASLQGPDEFGLRTLAELRDGKEPWAGQVFAFMIDRLENLGVVVEDAAQFTLRKAWSIFCSHNGNRSQRLVCPTHKPHCPRGPALSVSYSFRLGCYCCRGNEKPNPRGASFDFCARGRSTHKARYFPRHHHHHHH